MSVTVHMTATVWVGFDQWRVHCRCGWADKQVYRDRHLARAAGDVHLAQANNPEEEART